MNVQTNVAFWIKRAEMLPEEEMMLVFHIKHRKAYNLAWGYYFRGEFIERHPFKCWKRADVDYWMPIPLLPKG